MLNRTEVIALINGLGKAATQAGGGPVDLSDYYKRAQVEALVDTCVPKTVIPDNDTKTRYMAKDENNNIVFLEIPTPPDLSPYATKTQVQQIEDDSKARDNVLTTNMATINARLPTFPTNISGRDQLLTMTTTGTLGLINKPRTLNTYSCEELDQMLADLNANVLPQNTSDHPLYVTRKEDQTIELIDPPYELATDAADAHQTLQDNIDTKEPLLPTNIDGKRMFVTKEADNSVSLAEVDFTDVNDALDQLRTDLTTETTTRTTDDTTLQDNIDALIPTNTQSKRLFVTREANNSIDLQEVDFTDVNADIADLKSKVQTNTTQIATNRTDFTDADTILQTNIDTLTTSKQDKLPTNSSGIRKFVTKEADDSVGLQDVDFTAMQTKIDALETKHDAYETSNDAAVANKVDKAIGKQLSTEDYTTAEKTKLAGLSVPGNGTITVVQPGTTDQTFKVNQTTDTTITLKDTTYTHPTTSGNKHIPSGGSSGQILGWSSDGTAKWQAAPSSAGTMSIQTITLTNYQALPATQQNNGTLYIITAS